MKKPKKYKIVITDMEGYVVASYVVDAKTMKEIDDLADDASAELVPEKVWKATP